MLVFGTLHTNNARKTVDRMIDVFPSNQQPQVRTMLSSSLRGIVAQLLMKRSDGSGRISRQAPGLDPKRVGQKGEQTAKATGEGFVPLKLEASSLAGGD